MPFASVAEVPCASIFDWLVEKPIRAPMAKLPLLMHEIVDTGDDVYAANELTTTAMIETRFKILFNIFFKF